MTKNELKIIPEITGFCLEKIKFPAGGGVDVSYTSVLKNAQGEDYETSHKTKTKELQHPDMDAVISKFVPILTKVVGFDEAAAMGAGGDVVETNKALSVMYDRIRIVSVAIPSNTECVITAEYKTANGDLAAVVTPKINTILDDYGIEKELIRLMYSITEEAYYFLFEGKQAEATLFDFFDSEKPKELKVV